MTGSDEKPHRVRRDGWTSLRRGAFLRALGETGSVRDACARVQVSRVSAYALRKRCAGFAAAWERALAEAVPTLEQAAYERAVHGWDEAVWYGGQIVGQRRRYSDALLRMLLQRMGDDKDAAKDDKYRATQAETDALLKQRLRSLRLRYEREGRYLPGAGEPRRDVPETGERDADGDDRGTAGAVRHGDGPRIRTFP